MTISDDFRSICRIILKRIAKMLAKDISKIYGNIPDIIQISGRVVYEIRRLKYGFMMGLWV